MREFTTTPPGANSLSTSASACLRTSPSTFSELRRMVAGGCISLLPTAAAKGSIRVASRSDTARFA